MILCARRVKWDRVRLPTRESGRRDMANFTLQDNVTDVSSATMRLDGDHDKKRLRLVGVKGEKKDIVLESDKQSVAVVNMVAAFDDSKGIWSIDVIAKGKGDAKIQAKVKGDVVAKLAVTVTDPMVLPANTTEAGLLARLLLAENTTPDENGYDAAKAKTAMQQMRMVLNNRLNSKNPGHFRAPGAKTIQDIVKGKNQFE